MNLAISHAWRYQALALPNPSVGCVIVGDDGDILSLEAHHQFGYAHAELLALKNALIKLGDNDIHNIDDPFECYDHIAKNHNGLFHKTKIFVTLEPCSHVGKTPSCAKLLSIVKPQEVIISNIDTNKIASGGISILENNDIKVTCGVLQKQGKDLLYPFLCMSNYERFNLYKLAQTLNGSFEGGVISCEDSRIYSHKMRNIANSIVISQRTVLKDNPFLDSRLISGKAPDVFVLGKENRLKKDLNLFKSHRDVNFIHNTDAIPMRGFNIFEGGDLFFDSIKDKIDCVLLFIAPKVVSGRSLSSNFNGRILNAMTIGSDICLWIQSS